MPLLLALALVVAAVGGRRSDDHLRYDFEAAAWEVMIDDAPVFQDALPRGTDTNVTASWVDGSHYHTSEVFGLAGADCDTVQAESVEEFVENEQIELGEAGHVSMTGVIVDIGEGAQEAGLADAADIRGASLTVTMATRTAVSPSR